METKITIKNARFSCIIGLHKRERLVRQNILITLTMSCRPHSVFSTDNIKDTIDYAEVHNLVEEMVRNNEFYLIETLAGKISDRIMDEFSIDKITCQIKKPSAIASADYASVEVTRVRNHA